MRYSYRGPFFSLVYVEERPKPTVALEYMFARRSTASGAKEIAHIWDLGKSLIYIVSNTWALHSKIYYRRR